MNFKKQYLAKEDDLYFIAEIGINHNGLFDLAINMIDKSKEAGAKAVKFQKRNPEYKNTLYLDKDGVLNTAFYRSSKLSSPRNLDEVNIKQDIEDILIFSKKKNLI